MEGWCQVDVGLVSGRFRFGIRWLQDWYRVGLNRRLRGAPGGRAALQQEWREVPIPQRSLGTRS